MLGLRSRIAALDARIWRAGGSGHDPYDVLNSPPLLRLARRSQLAGVALTQIFRFLPVNPRRLLGIPKLPNAKTMALLGSAYVRLHRQTGQPAYADRARYCLDWLDAHRSPGFANASWGYSFPWCSLRQFLERDAPSIVCTAFVAQALLDAYEAWGDPRHLALARSACDFILRDCRRVPADGGYCFSYTPFSALPVHNANLLGVATLGRVYRHTGEAALLEAALPALRYSLDDQNEDGAWYYHGPYAGRDGTIDSFHTGFNLVCLRRFQEDAGRDLRAAIDRGQAFYECRFFDADGYPFRKLGRRYPLDIRDPAQLLITVGGLAEPTAGQLELAARVLSWTNRHMWSRRGYYYFTRLRQIGPSPCFPRAQAWMLLALTVAGPMLERQHARQGTGEAA